MNTEQIVTDSVFVDTAATAVTKAPVAKIDLGARLTSLTDEEHR